MQRIRSNHAVHTISAAAASLALMIMLPAVAFAQQVSPQSDQYERGVVAAASFDDPSASAGSSGDTLPFTGLDLIAVIAIGVGLLGVGLLIRHLARTETDPA